MPPEIQDNLGLILIVAVLIYAAWKYKQNKTVAPATQQEAAPVYIQAPAGPAPKLLDLHMDYDADRAREIHRQIVQKRLDQQTLDRAALEKIGEILTAPKTDPK